MMKVLGKTAEGEVIVVMPAALLQAATLVFDLVRGVAQADPAVAEPVATTKSTKVTKTPRGVYGRGRPKPRVAKLVAGASVPNHVRIKAILADAKAPMSAAEIAAEVNKQGVNTTAKNVGVCLCESREQICAYSVGKRDRAKLYWPQGKMVPGKKRTWFNPASRPAASPSGRLALIKARAERLNNADPVERASELANRQRMEDQG